MTKRKASASEKDHVADQKDNIPSLKRSKTSNASSAPRKRVTKKAEEKLKKTDLRGLLLDLAQAPLDIVFAIFQHLEPYDLLCLARSTKDIRLTLMNESTSHLMWEAARTNVPDLPPKPEDMDEPVYANLMYDAHCHECLGLNCTNVIWAWRMRLCRRCEKELRLEANELDFVPNPPFITKEEFLDLVPHCEMEVVKHAPRVNCWLESIVNDYLEEYEREVTDEPSVLEWKTRMRIEGEELQEHSKKCHGWYAKRLYERSFQRKALLKERRREIRNRLGVKRNDLRCESFYYHPRVYVAKKLTELVEENGTHIEAAFSCKLETVGNAFESFLFAVPIPGQFLIRFRSGRIDPRHNRYGVLADTAASTPPEILERNPTAHGTSRSIRIY